jgi:23S rRNA (adenine1618-N6)-methyltransferase
MAIANTISEKPNLHPRNKHKEKYNFKELITTKKELAEFVTINRFGDESIDFFNPKAVKTLNSALLKYFYGIDYWDIPQGYLCPPIPGRAEYIHHLADLLLESNNDLSNKNIRCLDLGIGANCIYPIIGIKEYGWSFVGSDIDRISLDSCKKIIDSNPELIDKIELRFQKNPDSIFNGVIKENDFFHLSLCNPPFHSSKMEAQKAAIRKISNLKNKDVKKPILNFGGQSNELWCKGGEETFITKMIEESKEFALNVNWFTSLVSKESNLKSFYNRLKKLNTKEVKTIDMIIGNKTSRFIAWRF